MQSDSKDGCKHQPEDQSQLHFNVRLHLTFLESGIKYNSCLIILAYLLVPAILGMLWQLPCQCLFWQMNLQVLPECGKQLNFSIWTNQSTKIYFCQIAYKNVPMETKGFLIFSIIRTKFIFFNLMSLISIFSYNIPR